MRGRRRHHACAVQSLSYRDVVCRARMFYVQKAVMEEEGIRGDRGTIACLPTDKRNATYVIRSAL